ncbi:hypothetical protein Daura_20470 [Dactylosporangium aurantiacum]|uniref:Uncharacterized protein n=1 Tax=Dactylosporangium aurantiacum TaxID=35754 RepID=A0A9Q9IQY1_9ACTN|nr:hypothetical protein [Dactylosporangium aurantiacum]MDG6106157.1 hypothetical protein [Dactylosporangium aurantiacum]UWZ58340.1 hypothetical protein Daura_20470 [Dactylosporangium aurantiacum]
MSQTTTVRQLGLLGAVGGALTAISGIVVQGVVQPATDVPDDMWSYPWSSDALVPVSIVYAVFHALVFAGVLGFARSGAAGEGRAARIGTVLALTGTAVLFAAELLSIPVADQRLDATGPSLVGATFGVGTALSAAGFVVAGIAAVRAARWSGWRRFVALATGVWLAAMIVLVATPALAVAVGLYGVLLTALGVAVRTQPAPSAPLHRGQAVQI